MYRGQGALSVLCLRQTQKQSFTVSFLKKRLYFLENVCLDKMFTDGRTKSKWKQKWGVAESKASWNRGGKGRKASNINSKKLKKRARATGKSVQMIDLETPKWAGSKIVGSTKKYSRNNRVGNTRKRAQRLLVVRENTAERNESETPEERLERLNILRRNTAERMASETADEREKRLVSVRTNLTERIENESVHEREERLEDARERGRERRRMTFLTFRKSVLTVASSICTKGGWHLWPSVADLDATAISNCVS